MSQVLSSCSLQTYSAAKHDVKEMERVAKWFNNQEKQESSFISGVMCAQHAVVAGRLETLKSLLDGMDVNVQNDGTR